MIFRPFYRVEQLILRPVDPKPMRNGSLGPAFDKAFLTLVLDLQLQVTRIGVYSNSLKSNVTLSDICYKPMAPNNTECAITSPLEYFQHNATFFNSSVSLI